MTAPTDEKALHDAARVVAEIVPSLDRLSDTFGLDRMQVQTAVGRALAREFVKQGGAPTGDLSAVRRVAAHECAQRIRRGRLAA